MFEPSSKPCSPAGSDFGRDLALDRKFFDSIPLGLVFLAEGGRIVSANAAAGRILGLSPERMVGTLAEDARWEAVSPDGSPFPAAEHPFVLAWHGGRLVDNVLMGVRNQDSGERRWLNINAVPLFRDGGTVPCQVCATLDDVTAKKLADDRDRARNQTLELVAKGAPLRDILHAIVRDVEREDPRMICTILLLDRSGKHLQHGAAPSMPVFFNQAVDGLAIGVGVGSCGTAAATGKRVVVEDISTHPYWAPYTELAAAAGLGACWSEPIRSTRGPVLGTFAIYHREPCAPTLEDLIRIENAANLASIAIEHARVQEDLEHQARTDYLTGLANRRHFWEQAEAEVTRCLRYHNPLSLLMLDVDHFKRINDRWGHKVGDLVLQSLADTCRAALRDVDLPGRLGGEEFAVLLPETSGDQALEVAERLRRAMAETPLRLGDGELIRYTVSFGVGTLAGGINNLELLFSQADRALYQAKEQGRNRVVAGSGILLLQARGTVSDAAPGETAGKSAQ